jgi:Glu-tRNA(Gln) amidotransferase subunit E-like FAD-binding protein
MSKGSMLIAKEIQELEQTSDCWEVDYAQIEKMLQYAGKGESGGYEHFYLTLTLYHLNEALNYSQKVINGGEQRMADATVAKTLTCAYTDRDTEVSTVKNKSEPLKANREKEEKDRLLIANFVEEVWMEHPERAEEAWKRVPGAIGFLTGHVVQKMGGKGNTIMVQEKIQEKIRELAAA